MQEEEQEQTQTSSKVVGSFKFSVTCDITIFERIFRLFHNNSISDTGFCDPPDHKEF